MLLLLLTTCVFSFLFFCFIIKLSYNPAAIRKMGGTPTVRYIGPYFPLPIITFTFSLVYSLPSQSRVTGVLLRKAVFLNSKTDLIDTKDCTDF